MNEPLPGEDSAPLRVDFAGGWLDVPKFARPGEFIVNCAISPLVTLQDWGYERESGLGGSGAWSWLNRRNGVAFDLASGAGWQDPAVIFETGLCVWRSGPRPSLEFKSDGALLRGRLALYWTGKPHVTANLVDQPRNLDAIAAAGRLARAAVRQESKMEFDYYLHRALHLTLKNQLAEGMAPLPSRPGVVGMKYCGSGHGGYAVYVFNTAAGRDVTVRDDERWCAVEPYCL
jgi:hypothetical protein